MFNFFKNKSSKRKTLGLALGGGGIKGLAHIGALKAFEENNIKFDAISGTSVGSIVGSAYALGMTSDEILNAALDLGFMDFFHYKDPDSAMAKLGAAEDAKEKKKLFKKFNPAINSKAIEVILKNLYGNKTFEETLIPFYAVAVDLITGNEIILDKGSLPLSCRASSSIPGVFTPTRIDNMNLVDGFVLNNLPADVLKNKGIDIIISINLKANSNPGKDAKLYIDVLLTTIDIMAKSSSNAGIANSDIIIAPILSNNLDMSNEFMMETYNTGYMAAMEKMEEIKKIIKQNKLLK